MRIAFVALLLLCTTPASADLETGDMTTEQKCIALRKLDAEYKGASLSLAEKAIKLQLVAWYRRNCSRKRSR